MHGNAGHEDLLDNIEWKSSDRGNKSFVGLHICVKAFAFLGQFFDGLLHTRDFIVKVL
jgi:hypothetical protein